MNKCAYQNKLNVCSKSYHYQCLIAFRFLFFYNNQRLNNPVLFWLDNLHDMYVHDSWSIFTLKDILCFACDYPFDRLQHVIELQVVDGKFEVNKKSSVVK